MLCKWVQTGILTEVRSLIKQCGSCVSAKGRTTKIQVNMKGERRNPSKHVLCKGNEFMNSDLAE